jgi:hypothetical protein
MALDLVKRAKSSDFSCKKQRFLPPIEIHVKNAKSSDSSCKIPRFCMQNPGLYAKSSDIACKKQRFVPLFKYTLKCKKQRFDLQKAAISALF